MKVGVIKEQAPGERRVALVPSVVTTLPATEVLVETGAGAAANFPDGAYASAGATVATRDEICQQADVIVCVRPPQDLVLRAGQLLIGMQLPDVRAWAAAGATVISLNLLPRMLSRAQAMDALSSQANVVGYKAALVTANAYGGYFPMLVTAAGTVRPARVLVLGAGVTGLQALGTARRLGAVVTGYDVRPEARADVLSVGARFLDLAGDPEAGGTGGYARELTDEEREAQQQALRAAIGESDVVITAAAVPGRKPPMLVTEEAIKEMRSGSIVLDTAAGPLGGNVASSKPDSMVTVDGVTVIGAGNLAAAMPAAASTAYARNIQAMLAYLCPDGEPHIDLTDEVTTAIVVAHRGEVRDER